MKILIVAHTYPPAQNGVAHVAAQLAEHLAQRGHAVTVATQHHSQRTFTQLNGVKVVSFRTTGNAVAGIRGEVRAYQDFIKNGDWDIQHHHACQIWGFDALFDWFKTQKSRKIVVTPHGFSEITNPDWQPYFAQLAALVPHIEYFTSLSGQSDEARFLQKIGAQWHVVPNGVSLAEFENPPPIVDLRTKWGIGGRFWLLNVSNHVATKSHKTLHELARRLPEIAITNLGQPIPIERWNLGKMGLMLPCYYACLYQQLRLANYFTRRDPRATVVAAYQQADLFVLPSVWEAAPLVILEAMAAGLPWVAHEVGNVGELRGGLVVQNQTQLTEAIQTLRQDAPLRQQLGAEGRAQIAHSYNLNHTTAQYCSLYEEVLKK